MRKPILLGTTTIAAVAVGLSAALMSSVACTCETPGGQLAAAAGLNHYKAETYDAAAFEAGLEKHFIGRTPTPHELFAPGLSWCSHASARSARCFVPMRRSWLLEQGFEVAFTLGPNGLAEGVEVSRATRIAPDPSLPWTDPSSRD